MAESLINIAMLVHRGEDEPHDTKVADVDFGDCDDYSSESDRSFEADEADVNNRGDSGLNGHQSSENVRSRRRRRHGSHGSRRHKGGSRHKHKGYQPYPCKVKDDIEMQLKRKSLELQEKENAAAVVRREGADQQFMTFPVAPFNSTQFLMDEHSAHSPAGLHKTPSSSVLNSCSPQDIRLNSVPSTPAESNHETVAYEKKDKEFSDFFTIAHAESLQSLPKDELVKHYMNLEEKVAALQKKVAEQQQQGNCDSSCSKIAKRVVAVCVCDSICTSDTNSLSSCSERFVDFCCVSQSSICVDESGKLNTSSVVTGTSGDTKIVCAESAF